MQHTAAVCEQLLLFSFEGHARQDNSNAKTNSSNYSLQKQLDTFVLAFT